MYLKSLVLKGFKSFADRSALTLEPGITAIVGPNGSGKSNISDAVLWVLGERNAKNLRGQAMEDVIFAGSSARKPVGVAEVELVLDNSDGTLPVDYDEVSIGRRMYRSGESEYLINGAVVRRLDVLDILHDSGLGTGTHSIISQGNLDSILQSKPEDRRALIEEAAGVLKHKQRKVKSERKLANMDQHLARARDVVAEVERQLGPLERKAKKARAYQELSVELADASLQIAVDDLRVMRRRWNEIVSLEEGLVAQAEAKRQEIAEAEAAIEQLQEKIRLENVDASALSRQYSQAAAAVERLDSAGAIMRERCRSANARVEELTRQLESSSLKKESAQIDLDQAQAQLEQVRVDREIADAQVAELEEQARQIAERRGEWEREASAQGRTVRELEVRVDAARRKHAQTQEALTNGLAHIKVIESHCAELELQLERAKADADALAEEARENDAALQALAQEEEAARNRVGEAYQAREAARNQYDSLRQEQGSVEAQVKALEQIERSSMAAEGPARAWLVEHGAELACQLTPLSHVVSASSEEEALVEYLLGEDVLTLLVDDDASVRSIVDALVASGNAGAVSFLMQDDAHVFEPLCAKYPNIAPGYPLITKLKYPEAASRAVGALLGDVVVCESLGQALDAHAYDELGLRFATAEGSVVWPSGKVTIGLASEATDEGVLARVRQLEELRARLLPLSESVDLARVAADEAEAAMREAQSASLDLSQQLAVLKGKAQASRAQAQRGEEKLASLRRELEGVHRQRQDAEAIISQARPDAEKYEREAAELSVQIDEAKEKLTAAQDALSPLRRDAHRVSERLSEAKLAAATLAERDAYTARIVDTRLRDLLQLEKQSSEDRQALLVKRASARRMETLFPVFDELMRTARGWTCSLEEQAAAAQDSSSGLHGAVVEARAKARGIHDEYDQLSDSLGEARIEKGRLELQVEAGIKVIVEDCSTPLETALNLPELENRDELQESVDRLRRRIANLGTINPDAAAEYDELKVRRDYLVSQLNDLDSARRSLAKINRVIDARMKDDFVRTFEQVNANFQEIFAILFPGGSASLSLVDPDDLENTGIEVNAQPQGKRITKMMLMSGGEKSLTALALLFAVYRTRTTPFYILDEVEAALDDTNLRRLVSYVDQLRDTTQLIMITHQRRTMEMADVLFGVSMQADGVTKVISQKLDRALQYAE